MLDVIIILLIIIFIIGILMAISSSSKPYNRGYSDYTEGFVTENNPFCKLSDGENNNEWLRGFNAAKNNHEYLKKETK